MKKIIMNNNEFMLEESYLHKLLNIDATEDKTLEKTSAKPSDRFISKITGLRNNIAIIDVYGAIFRYENFYTELGYGTSIDVLAKDFNVAINSSDIQAVIFNIDSPGGVVNGVSELADLIYEAKSKSGKKVIAYAESLCCSAAYFIAAACDEIYIGEMASVGSIGVLTTYNRNNAGKTIDIVSSNAKNKRLDIDTEYGKAKVLERIDTLANIFVGKVATYRKMKPDEVIAAGDDGGVRIGVEAVKHKLVDNVIKFEDLIINLQSNINMNGGLKMSNQEEKPNLQNQIVDMAKLQEDAIKCERERIVAINALSVAGAESIIENAIATGETVGNAAIKVMQHMKANSTVTKQESLNVAPISMQEKALTAEEEAYAKGKAAAVERNKGVK